MHELQPGRPLPPYPPPPPQVLQPAGVTFGSRIAAAALGTTSGATTGPADGAWARAPAAVTTAAITARAAPPSNRRARAGKGVALMTAPVRRKTLTEFRVC